MAKHIVPPATAEQILRTLGVTQEDIEIVDRVLKEVEEEEDVLESDAGGKDTPGRPSLWYNFAMAKYIAPPATYEQLVQSMGMAPEEIEFVKRLVDEVLEEEEEEASRPGNDRGKEDILQTKKEMKP